MSEALPTDTILARLVELLDRRQAGEPEGLKAEEAAAYVGVSVRHWRNLNDSGRAPAPTNLGIDGSAPRWCASELRAWMLAGAPSRVRWQTERRAFLKASGAA